LRGGSGDCPLAKAPDEHLETLGAEWLLHDRVVDLTLEPGSLEVDVETKARRLGVHGFFRKPCDMAALLGGIREAAGEET